MANAPFTRDEAILILDTALFSGKVVFSEKSDVVIELSKLLNSLPIHPVEGRPSNFRNPLGLADRINVFLAEQKDKSRERHSGLVLVETYGASMDGSLDVHLVADAIRRNTQFFNDHPFGERYEAVDFPEGALLGHLHTIIEARDGKNVHPTECCEICHLNLREVYKSTERSLLQGHLLVPLTELNPEKKYPVSAFISVCPNCHTMLHQHRPWLTENTASEILR